jgi:hypothetical protein
MENKTKQDECMIISPDLFRRFLSKHGNTSDRIL